MIKSQSLRQQIADQIVARIKDIDDPRPVLVTKEPFEVAEIAITQFPAVLITMREELRETATMGNPGVGRRTGAITFEIRAYARGSELDDRRNTLIEAIEEQLEEDRYLDLKAQGVLDTQITSIEVIDRQPPLAEILFTVVVNYNYLRGTL